MAVQSKRLWCPRRAEDRWGKGDSGNTVLNLHKSSGRWILLFLLCEERKKLRQKEGK